MDLKVLFVEDDGDDAELMLRRLRDAGFEPQWDRAQTAETLREALAGERWQVALVDYNMPGFSGIEALELLAEVAPDLPAITVSGDISEETAVLTLGAGAVDYVLKHNLTRLAPAVTRAVDGADLRRRHRQSAESARIALHALDHASLLIMTMVADGTITYVNELACQRLGAERDALLGAKIWDHGMSMTEEGWPAAWAEIKQRGVRESRVDGPGSGGGRFVHDITANYLASADLVIIYGRDVTDRVIAEEAAHASDAMYRRVIEMASEGIWATDSEVRTTFVNDQMAAMLGYEAGEMLHRPYTDFLFDDDRPLFAAQRRLRRQGLPGVYDSRFRAKDGREVWVHFSSVAEQGPDGTHLGAFSLCTDITERRHAEDALRESKEQFEEFAQRIPGIVTIKDSGYRYVYASTRSGSADGVADSASWAGKTPAEVWTPEEAEHSEMVADRTLAGEVVDEVMEWVREGETRYFHSVHFPIPQHDGLPLVGGVSLDVTAQMLAEEEVRRKAEQLRRTVEGTVLAMGHVVESRDPYTAGHERRVAELAEAISAALGMGEDEVDGVRLAGLIHDIGKIAVPAEILSKPGRLSAVEFNLIKQHARAGYDIIAAVEFSQPVADMVLQHHERLDGSGYPQGLTETQILPQAGIIAVADVAEAMSSHRPYRPALGMEAALAELKQGAGQKYDAGAVAACVKLVEEEGFRFTP